MWPYHGEDEINAVCDVLKAGRTNYWTGQHCREFEKEFADFVGTPYAIALMNGTVALEAALYALDIGPDDEVITTCRTFIASASCIITRGAVPVLADVDRDSQNITANTIEPLITSRTKAIIIVHLAGWPCDMESILCLAKKYNLKIIEDCAQAHGASFKNRQVGSWGDIAAFSFCQDKIMTTGGEGGMITTHDRALWEKIWSFKDHGKSYASVHRDHPIGFRWLHESFGTNWRMTEMQAVIGRLQLKKLPEWTRLRQNNAAILTQAFLNIPALRVTLPPPDVKHAYYKYYVFLRLELLRSNWDRDAIMQAILAEGISCSSGICSEIYNEKAFVKANLQPSTPLVTSKKLGEASLMFLVHPTLTPHEMKKTSQMVAKIVHHATEHDKLAQFTLAK